MYRIPEPINIISSIINLHAEIGTIKKIEINFSLHFFIVNIFYSTILIHLALPRMNLFSVLHAAK